jgi:hypothetical protein
MSAPSEQEKYSIDDMMERLKNRPAEDPIEDGQMVTRPDGSQVIRVRKRKRRSHQPHKEERDLKRRVRMLQVSGALILLMLAAFGAGVAIVFANSAPFREGLVRKIANCSGAAVDLQQFRMNPTSANAGGLTLAWPEGNVLRNLTMRGLKAEIFPASFLGKAMLGEEVSSSEGTLNLRVPQADMPSRETPVLDGPPPIRFKRYTIHKLHILLGDPEAPLIRMMNSEGSLNPENASGQSQLLLNGGDLTIGGWPKLRLDRSHIEFRGSEVDVVGLRIRHNGDTRGVFELSGTVSPYADNPASTLAVQLDSYELSGIVGPELGRLFAGRIDTRSSAKSNYLSFTSGPNPDSSLSIEFHNSLTSALELNGFPFLFGLAQTLDEEWFARPVFENDTAGVIRRSGGNVTISDINFENKSWMALRGSVTMAADRRLSGNLEVGVAEAMIQASKNRRLNSIFGPPKEGFRWLTVKVGGGAGAPTDNFKELYESAVIAEAPAPANKVPSFEELTSPK